VPYEFTEEEFFDHEDIVCFESIVENIINKVIDKEKGDNNIDLNDKNNI
jgi:hypothetical protein